MAGGGDVPLAKYVDVELHLISRVHYDSTSLTEIEKSHIEPDPVCGIELS